jgi:hypothetical protein
VKLLAERTTLRHALEDIRDELESRYDGAPDSPTRWMGEYVQRFNDLLGESHHA